MRPDPEEADTALMNDLAAARTAADLDVTLGSRLTRCRLVDLPAGTWEREFHLDAPVSPAMEPLLAAFGRGFRDGFERWGYPIDGLRQLVVDGWLYACIEPLLDPDQVGSRLARAEEIADLVELHRTAEHWVAHLLPAFAARRRAVAERITSESSSPDLVAVLVDAVALAVEFAEARFSNVPEMNLLTAAFLVDAVAAGATRSEARAALVGSSSATSALATSAVTTTESELRDDVADEPLSTDLAAPLLGELVAGSNVQLTRTGQLSRAEQPPTPVRVAPHLEAALAGARLAQDVRERSRGELSRLLGTVHRVSLELGARLARTGALGAADDVWFLAPDELVTLALESLEAAPTAPREWTARVRSRRHEYDLARASTPPPFLGDPPAGPPPPMGELSPRAARVFQLAGAWIEAMNGGPPLSADDGLRGIGASAGAFTGVVRVVRHAEDVLSVEPGEVLVCSTTTPAWCLAIAVAGAVVAETGGDLSHPAITAREFGIPAVVGVAGAMSLLRDGDVVTVDGTAGTVRLASG